jgi:hypothetical protein
MYVKGFTSEGPEQTDHGTQGGVQATTSSSRPSVPSETESSEFKARNISGVSSSINLVAKGVGQSGERAVRPSLKIQSGNLTSVATLLTWPSI